MATFWDGDFAGPSGPVITIKIIVHGSWKGDHISGTFSLQIFGLPQPESANGTFQGTRIDAGE
ncbi:MAG TPA: hypothetical protein VI316_09145 [Candidatus Dormibacteraeota bacterium]